MISKYVSRLAPVALAGSGMFGATSMASANPQDCSAKTLHANDTRFAVRTPDDGAVRQIGELVATRHLRDAATLAKLETIPQAVWLDGGSPTDVHKTTEQAIGLAAVQAAVPVLVLYNIPGRDCGGYSAGGAQTTVDYDAWIDAIASAIGHRRAVIVLEPDALANLPSDCGYDSTGQLTTDRYTQLGYAVDALEALPQTSVYIDAGHSEWHSVGDMAQRLVQAGLSKTEGFFLNVSNYQPTAQLIEYGTWIGECISFASDSSQGGWRLGHYDYCASEYYPASPTDFSTWALSDAWYASNLSAPPANPPHFILDTSRNGQTKATDAPSDAIYATEAPGLMTLYGQAPYDQSAATIATLKSGDWCNPPGSGVGLRPTTDTGNALVDAYLWIKTVGESDGPCAITGGARAWDYTVYTQPGWPTTTTDQAAFDPLWGLDDPAAGDWFPQQALQLASLANPPL
jgi:endoglucanase